MSHVGRPDDGTDVTSFFNLEFNAPLKPMEQWREGITPARRSKRESDEAKFNKQLPQHQLQLLAAHPRQRRGGALGRQREPTRSSSSVNDLQALEDTGNPDRRYPPKRFTGDRERGAFPHSRPAEPGDRRSTETQRAPATGSTSPTSRPTVQVADRWQGVLADGRGGKALRHRPATARWLAARRPDRDQPRIPGRHPRR